MYKYQKIKHLRIDHDKEQVEIAKLLGTSQTQYSRWERGEREIPLHLMIKLAKYYHVSMDYICTPCTKYQQEEPQPPHPENPLSNSEKTGSNS